MLSRKARNILYNLFYRADHDRDEQLGYAEVSALTRAEALTKLEEVRAKRYPRLDIEDMLLRQNRCGEFTCHEILRWLGVPTHHEMTPQAMRADITKRIADMPEGRLRQVWRAARRTI